MTTTKTVEGVRYRIRKRRDGSAVDSAYIWIGSDGSEIDATDEEDESMVNSRSITDR